ncbi:3-oxoacyl-[acyl-carrier- ] synthase, mitochondrial [Paramuricea clavata]|uniref:3-oxoacyl-[acyl-carrier- ] synthase, mitochondrial n=1 Tax=Paramuricea clavata TaxID=317549 RepID=A0A6S7HI11_PARCT|nr:3-oxoacyl-[acyl-carrier- ] synthase, mitochondrial [Paramuricea clavata]
MVCENTLGGYNCKCRAGHVIVGNICKAIKTYSGRLSIKNLQYRAIYNDTQSKEYIELRNTLKNAIKKLYQNTSYGDLVVDVLINRIYNGSIRVDYEVMFNSTATNITAESLNTELEILINKTNGIIGNSLVLGKTEGGRLFIIKDKDECTTADPCDENAICNNTDGSFVCRCHSGFSGDGFICTDINECFTAPCHKNATCLNTVGSYSCTCRGGFRGDGYDCGGVNCSVLFCGRNEVCVKRKNLFYCEETKDDDDDDLSRYWYHCSHCCSSHCCICLPGNCIGYYSATK